MRRICAIVVLALILNTPLVPVAYASPSHISDWTAGISVLHRLTLRIQGFLELPSWLKPGMAVDPDGKEGGSGSGDGEESGTHIDPDGRKSASRVQSAQ